MDIWNPVTLDDFMRENNRRLTPIREVFTNIQIRNANPLSQGTQGDNNFDDDKAAFDALYVNYKKLFDFITEKYGTITIPKGTLIFHSNQYFNYFIKNLEPIGFNMKIQDIRTYKNKNQFISHNLPLTETSSRIYANFTPAGNLNVEANINASEHIYVAKEDIEFLQLPPVEYNGRIVCIKDHFEITSTSFLKRYIQEKNDAAGKATYCGYILMTNVDRCKSLDPSSTRIDYIGPLHVYPEILLLDGFDKFKKCGQYDLLKIGNIPLLPVLNPLPTVPISPDLFPPQTRYTKKREFFKQLIFGINSGGALKEPDILRIDILDLLASMIRELQYTESNAIINGGNPSSFGLINQIKIYKMEDSSKSIVYDIFDVTFGEDPPAQP
jgi:hypothetical protein